MFGNSESWHCVDLCLNLVSANCSHEKGTVLHFEHLFYSTVSAALEMIDNKCFYAIEIVPFTLTSIFTWVYCV